MTGSRYRLRHDGSDLRVKVWLEGKHNHARLLVDGAEAAAGHTDEAGRIDLTCEGGPRVRVQFWWKGRVWRVALVEKGALKPVLTPFEPPPGTRAARLYAFQQRRPGLYAARHVALNAGGTLLAILGVSALLRALLGALLPRLDRWIDLPDWSAPHWLRWINPLRYLEPVIEWIGSRLPDLSFPWAKYVVGFLIACGVAAEEYKRRKKRAADAARAGAERGTTDADGQS
ncbi:hypothetical protein [Streptomyces abyssomicinicus]|uniref:hypothetical protein n=1 Tax=Streptomyces abyssomicinicus TaxID=574929 RepID=UPI001250C538|nr:hypothetical protein [Streptomyces abyssomicinicus]